MPHVRVDEGPVDVVQLDVVVRAVHVAEADHEVLAVGQRRDGDHEVAHIDGALERGQTLQQAMEMMIQAKVFDGSKACITFIRESSMGMRDSHPKAFKSLWMN